MTNRNLAIVGRWVVSVALSLAMMAPVTSWSAEPFKVGAIFSVTGRTSFLGDPEKKSLEMVVDDINAKGGIDGRMVEAVIYDTEGDPTKAVLAANKLVNKDQVLAIIGPSLTPTSLAVIPIAEKAQVPLISCAAGNKIVEPVKHWVFKTAQSDILAVAAVYANLQENNLKNVGLLTVSNAFGESGREQLQSQAAKFGLKVVADESFGANDTDMTAQLTKIRKASPDAIVCWGTNPGPAVVAKNVQQLNLGIPLYQSHGVASPKFISLAGDAAEGVRLPTGKILVADLLPESDPQKQVLTEYETEYQKRYNTPVSGFGGYAYDGMKMLAVALKGSGGDRTKIRDNLEKLQNHVGVSGVFSYSPEDHNGLGPDAFVMVEIRGGTWKLLQ
jgi:branched-chain amino acid transport system substrate-binding protein